MNRKNYMVFCLSSFLQALIFYYPIASLYRIMHGITVWDMSLIECISFFVTMALELPWGIITEKIGYKKVLILSQGLYALSALVFALADGFGMFLLNRIIFAIAAAGISGCDSSLLYLSVNEQHAAHAFGMVEGLGTAGLLCASISYTLFFSDHPEHTVWATFIAYLFVFLLTFMLDDIKEEAAKRTSFRQTLASLWSCIKANRLYLLMATAVAVYGEVVREDVIVFAQLRCLELGMEAAWLGIFSFFAALAGLVSFASGMVQKRVSFASGSGILFTISIILLILVCNIRNPYWVAVLLIGLMCASSMLNPMVATYEQKQVPAQHRAGMISFYSIISNSLCIGVDLGLGALGNQSTISVYTASVGILAIVILLSTVYHRKQHQIQTCRNRNDSHRADQA